MTPIPRIYLILIGLIVAVGGFIGWSLYEQEVGKLKILQHVADSSHFADSTAQVREHQQRLAAEAEATAMRQAAAKEVQKDRAAQAG